MGISWVDKHRGSGGARVAPVTPTASTPDPQVLADQQASYDQRTAQYDALVSDYDRQLRGLGYAHQAHNRRSSLWDQLEQQRQAGSPYGGNRFYSQGEIYQYDPNTQMYRGSISNQMIGMPQTFQTPELTARDPGSYEDYMAEDPYFQYLANQQAAAATPQAVTVRSPQPEPKYKPSRVIADNSGRDWYWDGYTWVQGDRGGGQGMGGPTGGGGSGVDGR
jgi:hypothetical protein